jgi:[ribosomal protein S5]-alanine N-acetyltransferase
MPVDRPPPTTTQPSEATVNVPPMRFPELRTPRFLLRRIAPADAEAVFLGLSDPKVIQHYGVSYQTPEEARFQMRWFEDLLAQGTGIWWAICEPSSPSTLIGATGLNDVCAKHLRGELGYWLLPDHWGRGAARECVAAVLGHAFGVMKLHRVAAEVDIDNHRSIALLARLGFQFEGIRRGCELKDGRYLDLRVYSRLATDPAPARPPGLP